VRSILRARRAATTTVAVLAFLGMSACSFDTGAAATVGDQQISMDQVQNELLELQEIYGAEAVADGAEVQRNIITREVVHLLLEDVAAENDVTVTGAEVDTFLEQVGQGADLAQVQESNLLTEDSLRIAARDQLLAGKLAEQLGGQEQLRDAVEARSEELGVTVNRRYGTWNGVGLDGGTGAIASELSPTTE
jgi:hypothetical protein